MRHAGRMPHILLSLGVALYLLCLWRGCPQLSEKGYFLAVLVMGIFAIVAHRNTQDLRFATLCRLVLLLALGLLLVGVWNMPLALAYKGLSVTSWFACIYGTSAYYPSSSAQTS